MHANRGHKKAASSVTGQKALLSNAYNEIGKALFTSEIKSVGNYSLGRVIGEGSFGSVRLALNRLTSTRCAIKQIPRSAAPPLLTREIHHHRKLRHPHIVQLFEIIATENSIWLVSELCAGGELFDYLVEQGRLQESEARRVFGQLCLGVAYIHAQGVVHRDLKLENILLDERCNVKIADFGFGREFEKGRLMETFCGTTGYASPEMLAGRKYLGEEVDVWALGIILYTLLTGSLPFDDDDETIMKSKIIALDYDIPRWLPDDVRDLIARILILEPKDRITISDILAHPWFKKPLMPNSQYDAFFVGSPDAMPLPPAIPEDGVVSHQRDASGRTIDSVGSFDAHQTSGRPLSNFFSPGITPIAEQSNPLTRAVNIESPSFSPSMRRVASEANTSVSTDEDTTPVTIRHAPIASVISMSRSSSMGSPGIAHSRTPSRTKRRSVGSTLSERMLPQALPPVVDYVALLEDEATPLLATSLEKTLLNSLSAMGFDTGQIIHSVKTDACDCSSAIWWQLKRKAEERAENYSDRGSIPQSPIEVRTATKRSTETTTSTLFEKEEDEGDADTETPVRKAPASPVNKRTRPRSNSAQHSQKPSLNASASAPALYKSGSKSAEKLSDIIRSRNASAELLSGTTSPSDLSPTGEAKRREKQRSSSISILQRATSAFGVKSDSGRVVTPGESGDSGRSTPLGMLFGRKQSLSGATLEKLLPREKSRELLEADQLAPSIAKPVSLTDDGAVKVDSSQGSPSAESEESPRLGSDISHDTHQTTETLSTHDSTGKPVDLSSTSSAGSSTAVNTIVRTRGSLFSSFKTWFNEDRKKRKRSVTLAGFEGSSIARMGPGMTSNRIQTSASVASPLRKPANTISRRSSSGTSGMPPSRRSSQVSIVPINTDSRQAGLQRRFSGSSRTSFTSPRLGNETPTSDRGSRPASFVSTDIPYGDVYRSNSDSKRPNRRHSRTGSQSSLGSRKSGRGIDSPQTNFRRPTTTTQVRRIQRPLHHRRDSTSSSIISASSRRSSLSDGELNTDQPVIQEEEESEDAVSQEREKALRKLSGDFSKSSVSSRPLFAAHKSASAFASPAVTGTAGSHGRSASVTTLKPKLRNVFAQPKNASDDSEWVDEEDPLGGFASGFGQAAQPYLSPTSNAAETFSSNMLGANRYAGVGEAISNETTKRATGKNVGLGFRTAAVIEEDEEEE